MTGYEDRVRDEIEATIDRAGFDTVEIESIHVEVTDSFRRKLGECRLHDASDSEAGPAFEIRIAQRLFEDDRDDRWRDTVRHELAHAYVLAELGRGPDPHGPEWKAAARQVGADPVARYEGGESVDAEYVVACPEGCFERGYLQRAKRVKYPWKYACKSCETPAISYDIGGRPADPESGTCYVESIGWETSRDIGDGAGTRTKGRYLLACSNGCATWPYERRTKRIQNPWQYSCPECETLLLSCDAADRPTELEPGRCHVASIPWEEPRVVHACPNGCFHVGYGRSTDESSEPGRHRCENCGARTVAYPADNPPQRPEPGTNYVD